MEKMSELTEKYHLIDTDNGMTFEIGNQTLTFRDFNKIENLEYINKYNHVKKLLSLSTRVIVTTIKDKSHEELNEMMGDPEFAKWYDSGLEIVFDLIYQIFSNMIIDLHKMHNWSDAFPIENVNDIIKRFNEIIICIDIAIYTGLKKLNERKDKIIKIANENGGVFIINEHGYPVTDELLIAKVMEIASSLHSKNTLEDKELTKKVLEDLDLNYIDTIGNA